VILDPSISSDAEKRIAFSYRLDRSDYVEFSLFRVNQPEFRARYRNRFVINFFIWLFIGLALTGVMGKGLYDYVPRSAVFYVCLGLVVFGVSCLVFRRQIQRRSIRRAIGSNPGATFEGPVDLVMDGKGVECSSDGTHSTMDWRTIRRIEETPMHLFLMMSDLQALIIPKRDLTPELVSDVRRHVSIHLR
jgi:hypothetical protein